MEKYFIQQGDNFFKIAQAKGGNWQDYLDANPQLDPNNLKVGQEVNIPRKYSETGLTAAANRHDDVVLEVDGVKVRVTRDGEPSLPHELHLIIPRTEIRKVECPYNGTIETTIMLSNINIVNSPRIRSEEGNPVIEIENGLEPQSEREVGDYSYE